MKPGFSPLGPDLTAVYVWTYADLLIALILTPESVQVSPKQVPMSQNISPTSPPSCCVSPCHCSEPRQRLFSYSNCVDVFLLEALWASIAPQPVTLFSCSNLRPRFKPMLKSQVLKTCLQSVYMLPPTKDLKNYSLSIEQAPDTTVMPWA